MARTDSDISKYWKGYYESLGNLQDQGHYDALNNQLDHMIDKVGTRNRTSWWHFVITADECSKDFMQSRNQTLMVFRQIEHLRNCSPNFFMHTAGSFTGLVKHVCIPSTFTI